MLDDSSLYEQSDNNCNLGIRSGCYHSVLITGFFSKKMNFWGLFNLADHTTMSSEQLRTYIKVAEEYASESTSDEPSFWYLALSIFFDVVSNILQEMSTHYEPNLAAKTRESSLVFRELSTKMRSNYERCTMMKLYSSRDVIDQMTLEAKTFFFEMLGSVKSIAAAYERHDEDHDGSMEPPPAKTAKFW